MDANQFSGSDDRDTLGPDPMACTECDRHPCICETHCLRHGKERVDTPFGLSGGCVDCERQDEVDL